MRAGEDFILRGYTKCSVQAQKLKDWYSSPEFQAKATAAGWSDGGHGRGRELRARANSVDFFHSGRRGGTLRLPKSDLIPTHVQNHVFLRLSFHATHLSRHIENMNEHYIYTNAKTKHSIHIPQALRCKRPHYPCPPPSLILSPALRPPSAEDTKAFRSQMAEALGRRNPSAECCPFPREKKAHLEGLRCL